MIHLHMSEGAIGLLLIIAIYLLLVFINTISSWIEKLRRKKK